MESYPMSIKTSKSCSPTFSTQSLFTPCVDPNISVELLIQDLDQYEHQIIQLSKQNIELKKQIVSLSQQNIHTKAKLSNFKDLKHLRNSVQEANQLIKICEEIKNPKQIKTRCKSREDALTEKLSFIKQHYEREINFYQNQLQAKSTEIMQLKCLYERKSDLTEQENLVGSEQNTTARESISNPRSLHLKPKINKRRSTVVRKQIKNSRARKGSTRQRTSLIPSSMRITTMIINKKKALDSFQS